MNATTSPLVTLNWLPCNSNSLADLFRRPFRSKQTHLSFRRCNVAGEGEAACLCVHVAHCMAPSSHLMYAIGNSGTEARHLPPEQTWNVAPPPYLAALLARQSTTDGCGRPTGLRHPAFQHMTSKSCRAQYPPLPLCSAFTRWVLFPPGKSCRLLRVPFLSLLFPLLNTRHNIIYAKNHACSLRVTGAQEGRQGSGGGGKGGQRAAHQHVNLTSFATTVPKL